MRPRIAQVIAALVAAVCFVLAFVAAGALLVSSLFMLAGLLAVAWLAWTMIRRVQWWGRLRGMRERRRDNPA
jgi:ABC-type Mn2+/Zn2+ transport system permease subunit